MARGSTCQRHDRLGLSTRLPPWLGRPLRDTYRGDVRQRATIHLCTLATTLDHTWVKPPTHHGFSSAGKWDGRAVAQGHQSFLEGPIERPRLGRPVAVGPTRFEDRTEGRLRYLSRRNGIRRTSHRPGRFCSAPGRHRRRGGISQEHT